MLKPKLTPVEEVAENVLSEVMMFLTGYVNTERSTADYADIVGRVKMGLKALAAKRAGCWSGRHLGICTCLENKIGTSRKS